jgi:diguanylate cyclase (GGDEF)-like protein
MLDHIESLKKAATSDHLTGLYNRRYFFDIGETLFKNAKRDNMDITVAMVAIDNFKRINDRYGHQFGDILLQHISTVILNHLRSSDVVCRFGGEEFCILATNIEKTRCQTHFEGLRSAVESECITYEGENIGATISIDVMPTISDSLEGMIQTADKRLYQTKAAGRNQVISA